MLTINQIKIKLSSIDQTDDDVKKYSLARIIVSLITLLGIRHIVLKMLQ